VTAPHQHQRTQPRKLLTANENRGGCAELSPPQAALVGALRCWHSVFFTCPLLDSRKKRVFVACNKKHKKSFFCPLETALNS
jgi:hypothetical protein